MFAAILVYRPCVHISKCILKGADWMVQTAVCHDLLGRQGFSVFDSGGGYLCMDRGGIGGGGWGYIPENRSPRLLAFYPGQ